jgi:ABC-type dipeptide/oligopeptide/nickel transport system permease component
VKNFVAGDEYGWPGLGYSFTGNVSVLSEVTERAPRTLLPHRRRRDHLARRRRHRSVCCRAVKRQTAADRAAMGFVLFGISAPVFWLGLMALSSSGRSSLDGGTGYVPITESPTAFFSHMILPWSVLASYSRRSTHG